MGSKDFQEAFKIFSKWYSATPVIDSIAFKMHYPITFTILLFAAGGVLLNNYAVSPIECHSVNKSHKLGEDAVKSYCWNKDTFVLPSDEAEVEHNAWYQWIPLVLILQVVVSSMVNL